MPSVVDLDRKIAKLAHQIKCLSCETVTQEEIDDLQEQINVINQTLITSTIVGRVENYSALPPAADHDGEYWAVDNNQGTSWLPGSLGGTYYSKGIYYSDGVTWDYQGSFPYQASQAQVDAGIANDVFVTPYTLNNWVGAVDDLQGLQDVLIEDSVLTQNNIIDANLLDFTITNAANFYIESNYINLQASELQIELPSVGTIGHVLASIDVNGTVEYVDVNTLVTGQRFGVATEDDTATQNRFFDGAGFNFSANNFDSLIWHSTIDATYQSHDIFFTASNNIYISLIGDLIVDIPSVGTVGHVLASVDTSGTVEYVDVNTLITFPNQRFGLEDNISTGNRTFDSTGFDFYISGSTYLEFLNEYTFIGAPANGGIELTTSGISMASNVGHLSVTGTTQLYLGTPGILSINIPSTGTAGQVLASIDLFGTTEFVDINSLITFPEQRFGVEDTIAGEDRYFNANDNNFIIDNASSLEIGATGIGGYLTFTSASYINLQSTGSTTISSNDEIYLNSFNGAYLTSSDSTIAITAATDVSIVAQVGNLILDIPSKGTAGYVLTSIDVNGTAEWLPFPSGSKFGVSGQDDVASEDRSFDSVGYNFNISSVDNMGLGANNISLVAQTSLDIASSDDISVDATGSITIDSHDGMSIINWTGLFNIESAGLLLFSGQNISSSTLGTYRIDIPSKGTIGHVLTSVDTDGVGEWKPVFTLPSLTNGSVLFSNGTTIAQDNTNFFWDDSNNRLGLLTNAPTHTLTLSNTSTGISHYNTSDQTTNYERLWMGWTTNTFRINAEAGGTGTTRGIQMQSASLISLSTPSVILNSAWASSTSNRIFVYTNGSSTASSGTPSFLASLPTVNQSSTAGYKALWVSPYEQTTGSGTKLLLDLGLNTAASGAGTHTSVFSVSSSGDVKMNSIANTTTANVLYYDTTSKSVTYGAAPAGGLVGLQDVLTEDSALTTDNTITIPSTNSLTINNGDVASGVGTQIISDTDFITLNGITSATDYARFKVYSNSAPRIENYITDGTDEISLNILPTDLQIIAGSQNLSSTASGLLVDENNFIAYHQNSTADIIIKSDIGTTRVQLSYEDVTSNRYGYISVNSTDATLSFSTAAHSAIINTLYTGDIFMYASNKLSIEIPTCATNYVLTCVSGITKVAEFKDVNTLLDADLIAIAALGFTSTAFLKKTAANTWALDTNTYLTAETDPKRVVSLAFTGTTTKTLTLTLADSSTVSNTFTDMSGSGGAPTVTTVTAATHNETATSGEVILLVDPTSNNITVNLPTAVGNTAKITIKRITGGSNTLTVDANSTETIDGGLTASIILQYTSITLISNNSNWFII
jgi:hypothetical protein